MAAGIANKGKAPPRCRLRLRRLRLTMIQERMTIVVHVVVV